MSDVAPGHSPQVLLLTPWDWHLSHAAKAFAARGALGGLWMSTRDRVGLPAGKYRRCWPFHLAMRPLYAFAPQRWIEEALYACSPLWRLWLGAQKRPPFNVVHAIMGFCTEPFNYADQVGALRVLDCPCTHPVTFYGFWQRECDLWCPGNTVPIPRWMFARMHRELERADLIIVQSKFSKESMILNGIPADKVLINPMGVDTSVFTPRTEVPARPRFVSVGTIRLLKGHQYLLRAFQIVKQKLPEAELLLVGQYYPDFHAERRRWAGTCTHIPHLTHPELAKLLQTCTAFVFPSQQEGIARAQMEALAAGLPVIGTHEGGATTVVEDGVEGFIVRGRDPQHIAEAMLKVATDRELNRRMGEAAHRRGAVRNTWQDYGDRLLAEYERRLAERVAVKHG